MFEKLRKRTDRLIAKEARDSAINGWEDGDQVIAWAESLDLQNIAEAASLDGIAPEAMLRQLAKEANTRSFEKLGKLFGYQDRPDEQNENL